MADVPCLNVNDRVNVIRHQDIAYQFVRESLSNFAEDINKNLASSAKPFDCLIVNTTGELKHFYEHATVIFIGKSLLAEGGQNPIEAGALGKAMVFGPNMQNFAEIVRSFVAQKAAIQVRDAFLSVAAHELRTPLTSVRGFSQLALRQLERGDLRDTGRVKQSLVLAGERLASVGDPVQVLGRHPGVFRPASGEL